MNAWRENVWDWLIVLIVGIALIVLLAWLARPVIAPEPTPPGVTVTPTATATSWPSSTPTATATRPPSTPTPTALPPTSTPTAVASATATATATALPRPSPTPVLLGWHTVRGGETLHGIGLSWYRGMILPDSYAVWGVIWHANRDTVENPRLIYPGQELRVPNR